MERGNPLPIQLVVERTQLACQVPNRVRKSPDKQYFFNYSYEKTFGDNNFNIISKDRSVRYTRSTIFEWAH